MSPPGEMIGKAATRSKKRPNAVRRIAVITGSRAEYGLLRSTMEALARRRNVELQVVVTGSHLLPRFGETVHEIIADGWSVAARIPMQTGDGEPLDQARGLARGVSGIAEFLESASADMVVVLGDRIEAMAGALAAVTTGRVLAHIHGGDLAEGDFDDSLRHAITKLAHLHFPATSQAARRIVRMGEDQWRVHTVGAPGLDRINELWESTTWRKASVRSSKFARSAGRSRVALIVQHPCGRSAAIEQSVMNNILKSVRKSGMRALCLYPNTDRGHEGILHAIECHAAVANGDFRVVPSLHRDDFLLALRDADLLVGNSSSGIIESGSLGTPAINIGPRQTGRQACGPGVIHCRESLRAIQAAVRKALNRKTPIPRTNLYGDGKSGIRIARVLAQVPLNRKLTTKLNSF